MVKRSKLYPAAVEIFCRNIAPQYTLAPNRVATDKRFFLALRLVAVMRGARRRIAGRQLADTAQTLRREKGFGDHNGLRAN